MNEALPDGALRYACQRVQDFALINASREEDEKVEAWDLWLSNLGVTEAMREEFYDWAGEFFGDWCEGALFLILLGLTVGLWVREYDSV